MQVTARQIADAVSLDVTNVRRTLRQRSIPVKLGKSTTGSGRKGWIVEARHLPDDWAAAVYAHMAREGNQVTFDVDRPYRAAAATLKPKARAKLDARLEIMAAFDRFAVAADEARTKARKAFCDAYNRRLLQPAHAPAGWVFESVPRIAWRTLFDWEQRFEKEGPAGVARITSGRRPGHSAFDRDAELGEWLRTHLIEHPSIALPTLHRLALEKFDAETVELRADRIVVKSPTKVVVECDDVQLGAEGGAKVARIGDMVQIDSGSSAGQWPIVEGAEKVSAA